MKLRQTLVLFCSLASVSAVCQEVATKSEAAIKQLPASSLSAEHPKLTSLQKAWQILKDGAQSDKTQDRAAAVRALSLLKGLSKAEVMARGALTDDKPEVRAEAAESLGKLQARSAIPQLRETLNDKETEVVLAAAHALVEMKNPHGYQTYYEILTGERKGKPGLVDGQLAVLKDPKKMAMLGVKEGIGFIPFGDIGYTAVKTIMKADASPVRAAAASMLAHDPDPASAEALGEKVVSDDNELVRIAALDAIAQRGDPALLSSAACGMFDSKDAVRFTAAATVIHLSRVAARRRKSGKK